MAAVELNLRRWLAWSIAEADLVEPSQVLIEGSAELLAILDREVRAPRGSKDFHVKDRRLAACVVGYYLGDAWDSEKSIEALRRTRWGPYHRGAMRSLLDSFGEAAPELT